MTTNLHPTLTHADQLAALERLHAFLAASSHMPDTSVATFAEHGAAVTFRTLRLVAGLADARSDAR